MHDIVNIPAVQIMIGTLPVIILLAWNLIKLDRIEKRVDAIVSELANIRERLATLEERDRWSHPIARP